MKPHYITISDIRSDNLALPFYFLSDNHLSTRSGEDQDKRIADVLSLLEEIRKSKGTLFILGDFFDFWFDKNNYVPPVLASVVNALRGLVSDGIEVHYIGGNHDYWIEGYLTRETGIRFYPDAVGFTWQGKRIYCQHGDHAVYIGEHYPYVRRVIRDPLSIGLLKILPIRWTYKLGERVSHYNKSIPDIPRVTEQLILQMRDVLNEKLEEGFDLALSGHVHAPYYEKRGDKVLAIIGDWIHHRSYGFMDDEGFKLIKHK